MNECGVIMPRREQTVQGNCDHYLAECIRKRGHRGPHVIKTPENVLIAWEYDWECGCCEPEEDERCYVYQEISEKEIDTVTLT